MGKAALRFLSCLHSIVFQSVITGIAFSTPALIAFLVAQHYQPLEAFRDTNNLFLIASFSILTMFCWSAFLWSIREKGIGCPPWQILVLQIFALPQLFSILFQLIIFRQSLLTACFLAVAELIFLFMAFWISAMAVCNDWL